MEFGEVGLIRGHAPSRQVFYLHLVWYRHEYPASKIPRIDQVCRGRMPVAGVGKDFKLWPGDWHLQRGRGA